MLSFINVINVVYVRVCYKYATILAEIDMLENVEIGEQKRRNEAYEAAKKKKGTYDDK